MTFLATNVFVFALRRTIFAEGKGQFGVFEGKRLVSAGPHVETLRFLRQDKGLSLFLYL
jgi:hypothetical protein